MSAQITDAFVLPSDVLLGPVKELPGELRQQLDTTDDDYALSRPRSRAPARLLDPQAADLLQRFRSPVRIVDAVIAYSRDHGADPEATLEEAFPMLERLIESGMLVSEESREAASVAPSLQAGDRFAGLEVIATLQALDDSELHVVRTPDGAHAALKVFRTAGRPGVSAVMRREAAILRRLNGTPAPRLLAAGEESDKGYLVLEWCQGVSALAAAAEARNRPASERRGALLALCRSVARAYARLHAADVVHGDVHPNNLIVGADGEVTILDFGMATVPGNGDAVTAQAPRGGIAFFFEPEFARARRSGTPPPPASFLGEQYGVAATLYLLVTGSHYLDFALEPGEMLRQVIEDPPLQFTNRSIPAWPEFEALLATALAKRPEDRLADVETLARELDTLSHAASPTAGAPDVDLGGARALLGEVLDRVGLDGPLHPDGIAVGPTSSLNYGAAGIAYALYRFAGRRDDPALLGLADVWITRAQAHMEDADGCYSSELDITPARVGRTSTFHTAAGIETVAAIVAHARGDAGGRQAAIARFLERSSAPTANLDLTLGRSSTVLGCALLLEALGGAAPAERDVLRRFGDAVLESIWSDIAEFTPIPEGEGVEYLGMAHGWAGLLYAALRWSSLTGTPPPAGVADRLEELARCAEPWARGLRWRVMTRGGSDYMSGWCNGSAGYVHLWTLAHSLSGDDRWAAMAEGAAWNAWEDDSAVSTLCCGRAGRAYALLAEYRHTRDESWLRRARDLTARAATQTAPGESEGRRDSLYKGRVGVALLASDVEAPEQAAMPFFEPEGWPTE